MTHMIRSPLLAGASPRSEAVEILIILRSDHTSRLIVEGVGEGYAIRRYFCGCERFHLAFSCSLE